MAPKTPGLLLVILLPACAGTSRNTRQIELSSLEGSPGLYLGHSVDGEVVVAATHYDAMGGLATTDVELGLPARKNGSGKMLCARQTVTGTHIPQWICRYHEDVEAERHATQTDLAFLLYAGRATVQSQRSGLTGVTSRANPR